MAHPKAEAFIARQPAWQPEMRALRGLLLDAALDEDIKWGKPCYAKGDKNIAILQPMKEHVALMFFQGAQLDDPSAILEAPGPNSHIARRAIFRDTASIDSVAPALRGYIRQAIDIADSGQKAEPRPAHTFTPELSARLRSDEAFRAAFEALTPGRQREYDLFVATAKQSATREKRIDGFVERVCAGKGLRDA